MPAIAGTAGVALVYVLGLQLFGAVGPAALAALLLALDGLHIVHSRIGMLDIFVSTLVLLGFVLLVGSRRGNGTVVTTRWWGAGVAFGAAVAVKWSAVPFLLLAGALAFLWSRQVWATVKAFVVVPLAVYVAGYASFFWQHGPNVVAFVRLQWRMLSYGWSFEYASPDRSPAWGWPLLRNPVDYAQGFDPLHGIHIVGGQVKVVRVLALGNPVLWFLFLACAPVLLAQIARWRRWPAALIVAGYLVAWAPWLVVGRTTFIYYMVPAVPFMCLIVAAVPAALPERGRVPVMLIVALAAAVAAAVYLPLWTARPVSLSWYQKLSQVPGVPLR